MICPIEYAGMQLAYADTNQSVTALMFSINPVSDTYRMIVTDKNGKLIADETFDAGISQLSVFEDYVYCMADSGIVRINPATLEYWLIECSTQGKSLLITDEDEVLVCGGQSAAYYTFK